jgi:hypothetical protein
LAVKLFCALRISVVHSIMRTDPAGTAGMNDN